MPISYLENNERRRSRVDRACVLGGHGVETIAVAGSAAKDVFKMCTGGSVKVVGPSTVLVFVLGDRRALAATQIRFGVTIKYQFLEGHNLFARTESLQFHELRLAMFNQVFPLLILEAKVA
jgi:hypothetical protein